MNILGLKKEIDTTQYLPKIPVRNYGSKILKNGNVAVLVPRFKSSLIQKYLPPKYPFIEAEFDEIGSVSWNAIDGAKTVAEIAEELKIKFGENVNPAEDRLGRFIHQLYKNKFIFFK